MHQYAHLLVSSLIFVLLFIFFFQFCLVFLFFLLTGTGTVAKLERVAGFDSSI
jgi:hypothetical protein